MPKTAAGKHPSAASQVFDPFETESQRKQREEQEAAEWHRRETTPLKDIISIKDNEALSYDEFLAEMAKENKFKLVIELPPDSLIGQGLLKLLGADLYNKLRTKVFKKQNSCKVCGRVGALELHEVWRYSHNFIDLSAPEEHRQKLATFRGIQPLCIKCYDAKHLGLEMTKQKQKEVLEHFCSINSCPPYVANDYIQRHLILQAHRSKFNWAQNFDAILPVIERL